MECANLKDDAIESLCILPLYFISFSIQYLVRYTRHPWFWEALYQNTYLTTMRISGVTLPVHLPEEKNVGTQVGNAEYDISTFIKKGRRPTEVRTSKIWLQYRMLYWHSVEIWNVLDANWTNWTSSTWTCQDTLHKNWIRANYQAALSNYLAEMPWTE